MGSSAVADEQDDETLPDIIGNADTDVEEWTIYPDITRIPHNCTGRHVRAMILHQLQQVGCHTLDSDVPKRESRHTHVRMWVFVSDTGSDHKSADQIIQHEMAGREHDWVVRRW